MCSGNEPLHLLFIWKCLHFLPYFSRTALPHLGLVVDIFFLLALWLYPVPAFYLPEFLMRNLLIILLGILCMWWFAALLLLSRFFISGFQLFNYNVSQFIELVRCCYLCLSSNAGGVGPLFFQIFSLPLFLSPTSFWDPYNGILIHLMVSRRSLALPLCLRQ